MVSLNYQIVLILCQIFKIILNISLTKHETLTAILPIDVYTSIELIKTPETMKLFDSTKKFIE